MTNRTARTQNAELLQAQRHRGEHQVLSGRLDELTTQMRQLETRIAQRREALDITASQAARELISGEIARLEVQNIELGNQYSDVLVQISDLRTRVDVFDGRLTTVETRTATLRGDVDGLQCQFEGVSARSAAHATAISRLEAANGWVPIASAGVAGLVTYVTLELLRSETAAHIQWAWALAVAAVIGLIVSLMGGAEQVRIQSSTSSSAGAGRVTPTTPTPVVEQPQPAAVPEVVTPSPEQRSPAEARAAAAARAGIG